MTFFKMIEPLRDEDDPVGFAEGLTFEEARERAVMCGYNLTTSPLELNGRWFCVRCGVEMIKDSTRRLGFRHSHKYASHTGKVCVTCKDGVKQPIENFYKQSGSLDDRRSSCKECVKQQEHDRRVKLTKHSLKRSVYLKKDLWNTIDKVRGKQSTSDFVNQAIRAEIERRVKIMWAQRGAEQLREDGKIEAAQIAKREAAKEKRLSERR